MPSTNSWAALTGPGVHLKVISSRPHFVLTFRGSDPQPRTASADTSSSPLSAAPSPGTARPQQARS